MGITSEDLIRQGRDLEMSDEEWEKEYTIRKSVLDRYKENDIWANKIFKKVGILMTSHCGNLPFMKACMESHSKLGYWITVGYDNFIDPKWSNKEFEDKGGFNRYMPPKDVMDNIDSFFMGHHQTFGGVLYPFFWLIKWGTLFMSQFEYIYCINSDFILEQPENFPKLLEHMGDHDILPYWMNDNQVSTCFIAKTSALIKIAKHYQDHLIPFEVYEKYTQSIGNAEGRMSRAIKDLGLSIAPIENAYNEQMHKPGVGTWCDLVGFRHIHGELNYAYRYKDTPPPLKYLDRRYMSDGEYNLLKEYEDTQDKSILEKWWAK